ETSEYSNWGSSREHWSVFGLTCLSAIKEYNQAQQFTFFWPLLWKKFSTKKISPSRMSQSSLTGLHLACRDGDLEGVRVRLTDATSLELTAGESHGTPLHFACVGGSLEIVRLLLRHQADVHSRDLFHWVPLHASSRYGHEEVVGELLAAGAAVDSKDRWEGPAAPRRPGG
ncbi:unnamed protein product, partial [Heterosigma akashiwo]